MTTRNTISFKEWNAANPNIPFERKITEYKKFIQNDLISTKVEKETQLSNQSLDKYKSFLRKLLVIYKDDPEVKKLENIDFNDRSQIIASIPIFSKKIKDISKYYNLKRKEVKNLKERYSYKGTKVGLEAEIKNLFLSKYSKDEEFFNPALEVENIVDELQDVSTLNREIEVLIEELYNY